MDIHPMEESILYGLSVEHPLNSLNLIINVWPMQWLLISVGILISHFNPFQSLNDYFKSQFYYSIVLFPL